jgi:hypothetical protein
MAHTLVFLSACDSVQRQSSFETHFKQLSSLSPASTETITQAEIVKLFPKPEFVEAAGVLEMINKTPERLREYHSRLKLQLDETARLEYARDEGRQ